MIIKHFLLTLKKSVKAYIKNYDFYLLFKVVKYKVYKDIFLFLVSIYGWKNIFFNLIITKF